MQVLLPGGAPFRFRHDDTGSPPLCLQTTDAWSFTSRSIANGSGLLTEARATTGVLGQNAAAADASQVRLTQLSHGGGCGCKIAPSKLHDILHNLQLDFGELSRNTRANDARVRKAVVQHVRPYGGIF